MAVAFRSLSSIGYSGSVPTKGILAPAGVQDGDLLVHICIEGIANSVSSNPTPPSGWTLVHTYPTIDNAGFWVHTSIWTKIANSEPASYIWTTWTDCVTQFVILAFTGADADSVSPTPTSATTAVAWSVPAPSITAPANSTIIYLSVDWGANTTVLDLPTGAPFTFTSRYNAADVESSITYVATGDYAAGGATGTVEHWTNGVPNLGSLISIAPATTGPASGSALLAAGGSLSANATVISEFVDKGTLGARGTTTANQASIVLTTTDNDVEIGDLAVVVVAVDNRLATADADDNNISGVTSSPANTWVKAKEWSNNQAAAQGGATVSMWYTVATAAMNIGSTITAAFTSSATSDAQAITARCFGIPGSIDIDSSNTGATDAGDPAALDSTTINVKCLRIRGIAGEVGGTTSLTPTAGWTPWDNGNSAATGTAAEMSARAEHIVSTGTGHSSNPSWVSCDNASVYVAFKSTALQATFAGSGSCTVDATIPVGGGVVQGSARLAPSGSLAVNAFKRATGSALLAPAGALTVNAFKRTTGSALLAPAGSLSVDVLQTGVASGSALLVPAGSLTADVYKLTTGSALLAPAGSLTVNAYKLTTGSALLAPAGSLAANAALPPSGAVYTIFTDQVPVLADVWDPGNYYEMGVLFRSSMPGFITAIRFYKTPSESTGHIGNIWAENGTLLVGNIVFSGETASGWQTQNLPTPFAIAADTTYVASVSTGNSDYYVATSGGLASSVINGPLSTIVGANGVYGPAGAFPTLTFNNNNYFRDVVFQGTLPEISGSALLAPAVSLTANIYKRTTGSALLALSGSLSVNSYKLTTGSALLSPDGSLAVNTYKLIIGNALLASSGSLSVNVYKLTAGSALLAPAGSLSVDVLQTGLASGSALFAPAGSITVNAYKRTTGSALLAPVGSLVANSYKLTMGSALLATAGSVAVNAYKLTTGSALLAPAGSLLANTYKLIVGSALLAPAGSLSVDVLQTGIVSGSALFASAGLLTANIYKRTTGSALLALAGSLTANVYKRTTGSALLAPAGSVAVYAYKLIVGNALLAPSGSLSVNAYKLIVGNALLAPAGSLTVNAYKRIVGNALLAPAGSLTANIYKRTTGSALLALSGSLSVDLLQVGQVPGSARLVPAGSLTANVYKRTTGNALLASDSALTANVNKLTTGNALLASAGSLSVDANVVRTIFTDQVPSITYGNDATFYEMGVLFRSSEPGLITAIRFYKGISETDGHIGNIWAENGTLLVGNIAFLNETAEGWQTQNLPTPLAINANTTYVASVSTGNNTYFVTTNSGLVSSIISGPLSTVVGANGVFGPAGSFPTGSFASSNYFRDVVFQGLPPGLSALLACDSTLSASAKLVASSSALFTGDIATIAKASLRLSAISTIAGTSDLLVSSAQVRMRASALLTPSITFIPPAAQQIASVQCKLSASILLDSFMHGMLSAYAMLNPSVVISASAFSFKRFINISARFNIASKLLVNAYSYNAYMIPVGVIGRPGQAGKIIGRPEQSGKIVGRPGQSSKIIGVGALAVKISD